LNSEGPIFGIVKTAFALSRGHKRLRLPFAMRGKLAARDPPRRCGGQRQPAHAIAAFPREAKSNPFDCLSAHFLGGSKLLCGQIENS
jgi:hypothetical protein